MSVKHASIINLRLFPQYKEMIERDIQGLKKTVKEYFESISGTRMYEMLCEMLNEIIKTEVKEQYAYEQNLKTIRFSRFFGPDWYYTVIVVGSIDETREKELHDIIAPKILAELGLEHI
jgi:hypothetical protein